MLRQHPPLLMNWFRTQGALSNNVVKGFNKKLKLTTRKAYGYFSFRTIEIALYHTLAALPEPESAHKFC
ncbi:MAG: transposase [Gammaproteobacteria bacterium]